MPQGDAQRAWFPEMIAIAKKRWSKNMAWEDIIHLCSDMQDLRDKIKQERKIKPARMICPKCGKRTLSASLNISPRSLLFMLKKENITTEDVFKELDKDWKNYRKIHNLDAYGKNLDKIEKKQILGNNVFIVQENALVACFDDNIDFGIVDKIADLKPFKVVFKDAGFKDDKDRINVEERFKRLSPETKVTVM